MAKNKFVTRQATFAFCDETTRISATMLEAVIVEVARVWRDAARELAMIDRLRAIDEETRSPIALSRETRRYPASALPTKLR